MHNGLPIGFEFQAYFLDSTQTIVLDSLFTEKALIDPADADPNTGMAITPNKSIAQMDITSERYEILRQAKWVTADMKVTSIGNGGNGVVATKNDELGVQLVGNFKMIINGEEEGQ